MRQLKLEFSAENAKLTCFGGRVGFALAWESAKMLKIAPPPLLLPCSGPILFAVRVDGVLTLLPLLLGRPARTRSKHDLRWDARERKSDNPCPFCAPLRAFATNFCTRLAILSKTRSTGHSVLARPGGCRVSCARASRRDAVVLVF